MPYSFTDNPLLAGSTTIRALHIAELRTAIDSYRTTASLAGYAWTDADVSGLQIKAVHVQELRTALDEARTALGLSALSYTDPTLTVGTTTVKAVHLQEIRDALNNVARVQDYAAAATSDATTWAGTRGQTDATGGATDLAFGGPTVIDVVEATDQAIPNDQPAFTADARDSGGAAWTGTRSQTDAITPTESIAALQVHAASAALGAAADDATLAALAAADSISEAETATDDSGAVWAGTRDQTDPGEAADSPAATLAALAAADSISELLDTSASIGELVASASEAATGSDAPIAMSLAELDAHGYQQHAAARDFAVDADARLDASVPAVRRASIAATPRVTAIDAAARLLSVAADAIRLTTVDARSRLTLIAAASRDVQIDAAGRAMTIAATRDRDNAASTLRRLAA